MQFVLPEVVSQVFGPGDVYHRPWEWALGFDVFVAVVVELGVGAPLEVHPCPVVVV